MNTLFRDLAKRMAALSPVGIEQEIIYNFLFGALYALIQAERLHYPLQMENPSKSAQRKDEVRLMAAKLAEHGHLSEQDYEWSGGFYFNDALIRMAVCLEHLLRYRTGMRKHQKFAPLIKAAESEHGFNISEFAPNWKDCKDELDAIRHRNWDYGSGPKVSYSMALDMITRLFDAVDWAFKGNCRADS
ncbi:MAG: hypothetical protein NDI90_09905 [Nitrospira sp. BO4]|jgi:hypothetical protein|nr:hypothetical protein [Nitrospira sp. BO4]